MSKAKKALEEAKEKHDTSLELGDKSLNSFAELPGICKCFHIWL